MLTNQQTILSRDNTRWTQGIAALLIMLMHFVMQVGNYPRFLNVLGSVGVAAFLFISGFGLNESYKLNGLRGYWRKRLLRVVFPCWVMYLFVLPFKDSFDGKQLLFNLLFTNSDLWFVDFLLRWYVAFWVVQRFFPRHATALLATFSVGCMFCEQLWSEQSLSFLAGYVVSKNYEKVNNISRKRLFQITAISIFYGLLFMFVKMMPAVRAHMGTLPFNLILLNIKLPLAISIIAMPTLVPWAKRIGLINWCGRMSYELFIVHANFMSSITNYVSIVPYTVFSLAISDVFSRLNMRLRQHGQLLVSLSTVLLVGISYMLLVKYAMRITPNFGYICIAYAVALTIVLLLFTRQKRNLLSPDGAKTIGEKISFKIQQQIDGKANRLFWASVIILVALMLIVQYHFDPMQNRVDRWSAIANPLSALFNGEFPYLAKTHLGGNASPFPVWMIVHIPFYLLGNVGLSEVFSAAVFLFSVRSVSGSRAALKATILLAMCIGLWYETAVRSDLISNFLLLAAFINVLMSRQITFSDHPYALSVCAGLWLSTRVSVAFPLFVFFFTPWLRLSNKDKIITILIVVATFCATFLPLVIWDSQSLFFAENNPFSLQSRQGRTVDALFLAVFAIVFALWSRSNKVRAMFSSATLLLLTILIAYGHDMAIYNSWTDIFNSKYDITYLNAALPFLIMVVVGIRKK